MSVVPFPYWEPVLSEELDLMISRDPFQPLWFFDSVTLWKQDDFVLGVCTHVLDPSGNLVHMYLGIAQNLDMFTGSCRWLPVPQHACLMFPDLHGPGCVWWGSLLCSEEAIRTFSALPVKLEWKQGMNLSWGVHRKGCWELRSLGVKRELSKWDQRGREMCEGSWSAVLYEGWW